VLRVQPFETGVIPTGLQGQPAASGWEADLTDPVLPWLLQNGRDVEVDAQQRLLSRIHSGRLVCSTMARATLPQAAKVRRIASSIFSFDGSTAASRIGL
jgi:hypothetical protein